jgi:hypothetical protein
MAENWRKIICIKPIPDKSCQVAHAHLGRRSAGDQTDARIL